MGGSRNSPNNVLKAYAKGGSCHQQVAFAADWCGQLLQPRWLISLTLILCSTKLHSWSRPKDIGRAGCAGQLASSYPHTGLLGSKTRTVSKQLPNKGGLSVACEPRGGGPAQCCMATKQAGELAETRKPTQREALQLRAYRGRHCRNRLLARTETKNHEIGLRSCSPKGSCYSKWTSLLYAQWDGQFWFCDGLSSIRAK